MHAASEHLLPVGLTGEHLFAGRVGVRDLEHGVLEVSGVVAALSLQQLPRFIVSAVAVRGVGRPTPPDAALDGDGAAQGRRCVNSEISKVGYFLKRLERTEQVVRVDFARNTRNTVQLLKAGLALKPLRPVICTVEIIILKTLNSCSEQ